jgi:hypothetical protein
MRRALVGAVNAACGIALAVFALALFLGWFAPAKAQAAPGVVCLQADFPVMHSGYQVKRAAQIWNASQAHVRFTLRWEPGCTVVPISRYRSTTDGYAAYVLADHVYLNRANLDPFRRLVPCLMRQTLVHELGHVLGLPDLVDGNRRDVMSYHTNWQRWCGVPSPADVAAVDLAYAA